MRVEALLLPALAVLLLAGALEAQIRSLEVRPRGSAGFSIDVEARGVGALDLLAAILERTGYAFRASDPEISLRLDAEKLDVALLDADLATLVTDVAGAAGLHGSVDGARRIVQVRAEPAAGEDDLAWHGERAMEALLRAWGDDASVEGRIERLLRAASIGVRTKDLAAAVRHLEEFLGLDEAKHHPEGPDAALRGARCALAIGRPDLAWGFYDRFETLYPAHPGRAEARVLGARARMLEKAWADAARLLSNVRRDGLRRDVEEPVAIVAGILLAEVYWHMEEPRQAMAVLDETERFHSSEHEALLGQLPLYRGFCRRAAGEEARAALDFRLAAHTCGDDALRTRALEEQARSLLAESSPFRALASVRVALRLDPEPGRRYRLRLLEARAYADLDLQVKALEVLEGMAPELEAAFEEAPARRAAAAELMERIAELRFARGELDEALAWFTRIEAAGSFGPRARLMKASCLHRIGLRDLDRAARGEDVEVPGGERIRRALALLDELDALDPDEGSGVLGAAEGLGLELRRLRGDCFMALRLYERAAESYTEDTP